MAIPSPDSPDPNVGHKEHGRTICIHSLAVLPQYHHHGLGGTLLKAYLQRLEQQAVGDRVALISHEGLIPFYEKFGFRSLGRSKAEFAGGGWWDMVRELKQEDEDEDEGEDEVVGEEVVEEVEVVDEDDGVSALS